MKKSIIFIAALMIQLTAMAGNRFNDDNNQADKKKMTPEQRLEQRIKFVTKMLELDDATAAKFTPVYKEYLNEKATLYKNGMKKQAPKGNLNEEEAEKFVKERLALSRKLLDVREKYYAKFGKIIPATKVKKIYDMEQQADSKMRGAYNDRRAGGNKGKHPGMAPRNNQRNDKPGKPTTLLPKEQRKIMDVPEK